MSLLGGVGAPQHPLPVQTSIKPNTGSFLGRAVNWIKRTLDRAGYVNDRMARADDLFNQLKTAPEYGSHLANLATPDLGRAFKSTRPFSEIAGALREYAGAVRDYNTRRAEITDALADDPDLELENEERVALGQRVSDEPRWGTPGNDLARLVNEHRADQLNRDGSLSAMVLDAVHRFGLPSREIVPYQLIHDLQTRVIPGSQQPLTRDQAEQLARAEVENFCNDKGNCLAWIKERSPTFKGTMGIALKILVNTDPGMRSTEDLERVLNLANKLGGIVGSLLQNPTRTNQNKARDAFYQDCVAAGVTKPEEQELLLARAFDAYLGSMNVSSKNVDKYFPAISSSLKNQHDELAREIDFANAEAQPEQGVAQEPGIGLERFLGCLADVAVRFPMGTMPTLSQHQSGSFSPAGIQALQHELNKTLDELGAGRAGGVEHQLHRQDRDDDQLLLPSSDEERSQVFLPEELDDDRPPRRSPESSEDEPNRLLRPDLDDALGQPPQPETLDGDFNEQFLKDMDRRTEFSFDDRPGWPEPGQRSAKLDRFRDYFADDEPGMQAVTQVTNQSTFNAIRTAVMKRLPDSPFQASYGLAAVLGPDDDPKAPGHQGHLDPTYSFPDTWAIDKLEDGGYRVRFQQREQLRSLRDRYDRDTPLVATDSWLQLNGEFEIPGASIRAGRPCANVTSLTYDYQFRPKVGDKT